MGALRRVLCVATIATLALTGPASAASAGAETSSGLQIVGPDTLKLSVKAGKDQTEPVTVWLRNPTAGEVRPRFSVELEDTDETAGDAVSVLAPQGSRFRALPAKSVQQYRFALRGVDSSNSSTGQLVISADASSSTRTSAPAPASISVTVTPKRSYGNTYYWVLFAPALLALALVAIGWALNRAAPGSTIVPANLSFSGGFASTLTIVGALLGTIIAAGVLPSDTTHLADTAYKALNIIFGALIASAVLIYSAYQKQEPGKDGSPELHAYVWAFMLACAVTAWAAFGELTTLWFLIWDINGTSGLTDAGVLVLDIMIVGAGVAMIVYVLRRIGQVASAPATEQTAPLLTFALRSEPGSVGSDWFAEVEGGHAQPGVMIAPQAPSRPPPRFVL